LSAQALDTRNHPLLLELDRPVELPIGLTQDLCASPLNVRRELQSEVLFGEQHVEILFGLIEFGVRRLDSRCKAFLGGSDPSARVDWPRGGDRGARAAQIVAEAQITQRCSLERSALLPEYLGGIHRQIGITEGPRRTNLILAVADPCLSGFEAVGHFVKCGPRLFIGEGT
jgi:hypothetical protein